MKQLRSIIISSLTACAVFASTLYISCTKESCSIVCANGGTCNGSVCICPIGYEGTNCQITSRNKFLGSWNAKETGTITKYNEFGITVDTSHADTITAIKIKNFYDKYPTPVTAYVTGSNFTILPQVMPNFDTVSGWGTYSVSSTCPAGKIYIYFKVATQTSGIDNFGDSLGAPAILNCN